MMKLYPSWFTFFSTNLMGLIIVSSSTNWFFIWMGLEMTLFGFLPLFLPNKTSIESMTKYLLIQAGGSTLLLFSFLSPPNFISSLLLLMSMMVKLGLFPFYQWVPSVMASLNWMGCLILSTIQKLAPMMVLMKLQSNFFLLILLTSISILISGIMGMNQTFMRPLLGYSSISHTAWISTALTFSQSLSFVYIILYVLTNIIFMSILHFNSINKVLFNTKHLSHPNSSNFLMLNLLGMPPFSIFFLKMSVFMMMWQSMNTLILIPMILGSMLSAYFYLSFIIPSMMKSWSMKKNNISFLLLLSISNAPLALIL